MARIVVLGAGLAGLSTAGMLARDGHDVVVLERDPNPPPAVDRAWDDWQRRGVSQFRLPHYMHPRWWSLIAAELPEAPIALRSAQCQPYNTIERLPAAQRGELRPEDRRFDTMMARRPVLEAALTAAATAEAATIHRGRTVTGLTYRAGAAGPRVTGVHTVDGEVPADLVVDTAGRRSALADWLVDIGADRPVEERADSGFVYYSRYFQSADGRLPAALGSVLQHYPSVSILTLPGDRGTWAVVMVTSSRDKELRDLRSPAVWHAAVELFPLIAHWIEAEPITGVDTFAGIEDRHRSLVTDDGPIATGIVAVGDSWASTNPSLGRGATMAVLHGQALRDVLRKVEVDDDLAVVSAFHEATMATVEPIYWATRWYDAHRLAEIDADIAGRPYEDGDQRWSMTIALARAGTLDPDLARAATAIAGLLETPDQVMAMPGVAARVMALGGNGPRYHLPGPTRPRLVETVRAAG